MAIDSQKPGLFDRLGHFFTKAFYGKNMKDHQKDLDSLHKEESADKWKNFGDKTKDKSFVQAVKNDPRSSKKLKMHAESLNSMHNSKTVATVKGKRGSYQIKHMGTGVYGCTCNDWKYKGSVNPGYKCKHIREYIARKK